MPSIANSISSSVARSARFSLVMIPCWRQLERGRLRPCPSIASRSSAGLCSSMSSSTASASVSSASRARARSSSTMSSSKPSIAEQLGGRHVGDFLDRARSLPARGSRRSPSSTSSFSWNSARAVSCSASLFAATWSCGHDVELPAGQLAGQAHVLAAAADRLRQLVLGDRDVHRVLFFVDDDRLHFGRRHRVDDELRRIVVPQHDVDALAVQFVRHRLHARTAHADAGADRIGAVVVREHRDLGAVARIARAAP